MSKVTLIGREAFCGMHAIDSNQIVCIQRRPLEWVEAVSEQRLNSPQRVVLLLPLLLSAFSSQSSRVVQWDFVIDQ